MPAKPIELLLGRSRTDDQRSRIYGLERERMGEGKTFVTPAARVRDTASAQRTKRSHSTADVNNSPP